MDKHNRLALIIAMNDFIKSIDDEEAYMRWIYIVPDEATFDDLEEIAEDDELFDCAVNSFCRLFNCYVIGKIHK